MSLIQPFSDLLKNLQTKGIISEEAKAQYFADFESKINESTEEDRKLELHFDEALASAVQKVCDDFKKKLEEANAVDDDDGNGEEVKLDTEEIQEKIITIQEVFQNFLEAIPEENVKAFNKLSELLSDEQKALLTEFLSGDFDHEKFEGSEKEDELDDEEDNELDNELDDDEEDNELDDEENKDEDEELLAESGQLIAALTEALKESGLEEISESILSEASSRLDSLAKKHQREYEKFLKMSIKNLARKNKEMKLSGGVAGGVRRIRNADVSLQQLRKQLYLKENHNQELSDKLFTMNEKILVLESNKRSLSEGVKSFEIENKELHEKIEKIEKDNRILNESIDDYKKKEKSLTEQVQTAQQRASINEAKAYLVESTATLSPDLRHHLLTQFKNKEMSEVKSQLNEAVDAYRDAKRSVAKQLRKSNVGQISQLISEAVRSDENKTDEESDSFVAGLTAMSESVMNN